MIASLALPWHSKSRAVVAGGKEEEFDVYAAKVQWDAVARSIVVQCIDDDPLLGMEMLKDHELRAQVKFGGDVRIETMP